MNWYNLRKNKCPKCGRLLHWGTGVGIYCPGCGFKITPEKQKEILVNLEAKELGEFQKIAILCDRCKAEFMGPEYLLETRSEEAVCSDCLKDAEEDEDWG